jgi:hypothetical protein
MSVITNMPGDRQITLQSHIAADATLHQQNALADRMFAILDRQKARYELTGKIEELDRHKLMLQRMKDDEVEAEKGYQKKQATLRAQIKACVDETERLGKEGYDKHMASGRRGNYKPDGARSSAISGAEKQAKLYQEHIEKNEAEKQVEISNFEKTKQRFREEIAKLEADIGFRKQLLG